MVTVNFVSNPCFYKPGWANYWQKDSYSSGWGNIVVEMPCSKILHQHFDAGMVDAVSVLGPCVGKDTGCINLLYTDVWLSRSFPGCPRIPTLLYLIIGMQILKLQLSFPLNDKKMYSHPSGNCLIICSCPQHIFSCLGHNTGSMKNVNAFF